MIEATAGWRGILLFILLLAAIGDVRSYRIPNYIPFVIVVLSFAILTFSSAPASTFADAAFAGVIALIIGYGMFVFGLMGGGDSKLFAATAMWFGASGLLPLAFWISVSGVFVGLAMLFYALVVKGGRNVGVEESKVRAALKTPIPYGVAIAVGTAITSFAHAGQ